LNFCNNSSFFLFSPEEKKKKKDELMQKFSQKEGLQSLLEIYLSENHMTDFVFATQNLFP